MYKKQIEQWEKLKVLDTSLSQDAVKGTIDASDNWRDIEVEGELSILLICNQFEIVMYIIVI